MVKRVIKGHKQAKPARKIEVSVFMPQELFDKVHKDWFDNTPIEVSFSAFLVAKIEAGVEVSK